MLVPEYKTKLIRTMRREATPSEARLWKSLRLHRLGDLHFRRQRPIGWYVADFVCESCKLIVEVDGGYHEDPAQVEMDKERAAFLIGSGYHIVRVSASAVIISLPTVLAEIASAAQQQAEMLSAEE